MVQKSRKSLAGMSTYDSVIKPDYHYQSTQFFLNSEELITSSHRWPPKKGTSDLDLGGGFSLYKAEWTELGGVTFYATNSTNTRIDSGQIYPEFSGGTASLGNCPAKLSDAALNALGTTAIARTLPTKPLVSMGQFIGELKELPKFAVETWKNRAARFKTLAKSGASDYLNAQFGWFPFLKDIIDFCQITHNSTKHIDQFLRDSGRTVRRRYTLSDVTTTVVGNSEPFSGTPGIQGQLVLANGKKRQESKTTTKVWFSGAYRYYVPRNNELLDPKTGKAKLDKVAQQSEQLAHRLYGMRIDPHLLWSLAPWSWAVDWVSNAGDIVRNFSAFGSDNLVLKYGYIMRKSVLDKAYAVTEPLKTTGGSIQSTQRIRYTTLQRNRATPYGFGLSPGAFSARQWSIIGALGISKAPRSLNF